MKPVHTLLFLLAVLAGLSVIGALIPSAGLKLSDTLTLRLPSPVEVLFPAQQEEVDISDILALATDSSDVTDPALLAEELAEDTLTEVHPFVFDSTKLRPLEERIALHYPDGDKRIL